MEFTPKHCQSMSKIYAICSLGMVDSICGEGDVGESKSKRRKRTTYLSDRMNQCNDLARAAKEIRKWLTRGAGCRGVVPNARLPCSTCSCRLCHTFCDSLGCFDNVQLTCTLPYKVQYNNIDRIVPTGRWETQMHETRHAAAPQAAHTQTQVFPKRVHYNGIQMVQYIIPNATTNLPH